ncbi:50S ribosomal protein L11 methyltransferase [Sphingomonas sp. URHD0057]|uniref:50S ribosomal protein L11 methyltransferase n=1 Tax=Sphingomonas sp. URHD0057 TaxID=1380389 RepID=UPI0005609CE0|nr:50S ribosomal protein L11 methyltransferase [Sphingomonas sp. URHD0057]
MSFRVSIACTRAQGEAIADGEEILPGAVLVADEPDPGQPDHWLIHAYFEHPPTKDEIAAVATLGLDAPQVEQLGEADWVTMSQAGLQPIRAGRFTVHTPTHAPDRDRINFEIDAGLAFGTGQHATTGGCLAALDKLERDGRRIANIADIGTGTGLLAFAALALWPNAKCIATDIDPVAVDVARDNAAINRVKLGHGAGELLLAVADGMDSPMLAARAPFDLIVTNILAGPLTELAADFAKSLAPGGTIVLAGLLDSQADGVAAAYEQLGFGIAERGFGEWPVLVCEQPH